MRRCSRPPRCPTHQVDRPDGPHRAARSSRPPSRISGSARKTNDGGADDFDSGGHRHPQKFSTPAGCQLTDVGQDCRVGTRPHFVAPPASRANPRGPAEHRNSLRMLGELGRFDVNQHEVAVAERRRSRIRCSREAPTPVT